MDRKCFAAAALFGAVLFSTPAAAAQQPTPSPEEIMTMIRDAMNASLTAMLKPGPVQADWNKGGADLRAAVTARPGGLAGNYLVTVDKDGEGSLTIYTAEPAARFVPQDWERLSQIGNIDVAAADSSLEFGHLDGPYYFAGRVAAERIGEAYCSSAPSGAVLYRVPGAEGPNDLPAEVVQFMFQTVTEMLSRVTVCERFDAKDAGYSVRYFYDDGRSIPAMDDQHDRITIVPARPVMELLKRKAP